MNNLIFQLKPFYKTIKQQTPNMVLLMNDYKKVFVVLKQSDTYSIVGWSYNKEIDARNIDLDDALQILTSDIQPSPFNYNKPQVPLEYLSGNQI